MRFQIDYAPDAVDHLRGFPTRVRATIMDAIEEQLVHEPMRETRNRKQLRPNTLAPWELRVANWRVFNDVPDEPERIVSCRHR